MGQRAASPLFTTANTTEAVPMPTNKLSSELKALLDQAADARKAQREAEAPIRVARRPLKERVSRLNANLARARASKQRMMSGVLGTWSERDAAHIHGQSWRDCIARIERYTAELTSAEVDLAVFDQLNNIEA
jgi:chromosome segregation ATPase